MLVVAASALTVANAQTENAWQDFYDQAPVIRIVDPMASLIGSVVDGQNTLTIRLTDVALYTGKVCPGVALYPDSTPVRGQIRVAASAPNGVFDLASYITGARAFYGRHGINGGDLVVDPTLKSEVPGEFVIVFQRKDTGQAVKGTFDKMRLISAEQMTTIKAFKATVMDGTATEQQKQEGWAQIQAIVKTVIEDTPEGVIEIAPLEGYVFPEAPEHEHEH
jgi:hypothetical protein